jgi:hypothetical protein
MSLRASDGLGNAPGGKEPCISTGAKEAEDGMDDAIAPVDHRRE